MRPSGFFGMPGLNADVASTCRRRRVRLPETRRVPRRESPRRALHVPQRRVQDARIARIHRDVDRAGGVVDEQHALPRLAAVGRAIDAARRVLAARVAHRRDEHAVGIARVDDDARDVPRVVEAEVRPRLAGVGRAIHAVAVGPVFAQVGLAAADVDDVRIGRRDRDRADRRDASTCRR